MARMPGQPIDDDGRPVYPSNTQTQEDDVQGHIASAIPTDEDGDDDEDKPSFVRL